ncbi:MAG: zinc ABC transporter substrate-binding protein [Vallitalea sp.]|jgi:zinc transport system substrate-binding protein|nr:zinc ABC transporter substrate-binding protein [Vallitalea sp.]
MKLKINILLIFIMIMSLFGCSTKQNNEKNINIAVSIVPEATFVEAILGDKGNVTTVIPPGFSPANYQPSPKELQNISNANLYFTIGVPSEKNILPKIVNNNTKVISLREATEKDYPLRYFEKHRHDAHDENNNDLDKKETDLIADPHIWMSPKRVISMVKTIEQEIINLDPNNKDYYSTNAENYITKLENLDNYIKESLTNSSSKKFIIYHPSLGYFADDYGLTMMAIEHDGKKATIETITEVVDFAKENNISVILYQKEFDSKQAKVIAEEIGGTVEEFGALSKDYIDNIKKIVSILNSKE